jgi:hypothetical protein
MFHVKPTPLWTCPDGGQVIVRLKSLGEHAPCLACYLSLEVPALVLDGLAEHPRHLRLATRQNLN